MKFFNEILLLLIALTFQTSDLYSIIPTKVYFIDSKTGDDFSKGTSDEFAWRSFAKLQNTTLHPGDTIRFKRGSSFDGILIFTESGNSDKPIVLTDYGDKLSPAPTFTNSTFAQNNFGNCIKIKGSNIVIENLLFQHTKTYVEGDYTTDGGWKEWEMGALYVDKGANNCIIRNNEFLDCVASIRSYGTHITIEHNYIHDCNRPLRKWNWGPIGIWLGNDFQEIRYNKIINIRGEDSNYIADGADGGAIEIDDERFDKTHISLHHNFSQDCQGFLEVVLNDVIKSKTPIYEDFNIAFNVCDDYSAFCKIRETKNCTIDNNTVIRRKRNSNEKGILVFKGNHTENKIRNNIFVTTSGIPVFTSYNDPSPIIQNNLYFSLGEITMGNLGPGVSPVFSDPDFLNLTSAKTPEDFELKPQSPAINKGLNIGYTVDFRGISIPQGTNPDIGAFEMEN